MTVIPNIKYEVGTYLIAEIEGTEIAIFSLFPEWSSGRAGSLPLEVLKETYSIDLLNIIFAQAIISPKN